MRESFVSVFIFAVFLSGCSNDQGSDSSSTSTSGSDAEGFDPPPPAEGFTRFEAEAVRDVAPGADVTYCQYVMEPLDHDMDVLSVFGYQSQFGHHAAAFVYMPAAGEMPGANFPCMGAEFTGPPSDGGATTETGGTMGAFLGALGGEDGREPGTALPEGVGIRLPAGSGIMLNVHFLNAGEEMIDGDAVVDVQFAEPDPNRKLAAMFVNVNTQFALAPTTQTSSSADCVVQSDIDLIMMTNHMHEYGTSASTIVTRAEGGATEMLHEDPSWTFDMQFNAVYSRWSIDAPLQLRAGDTVRTTCNWDNGTSAEVNFPREMCVGVGFALVTGENPNAPVCYDGTWIGQGF